MRIETVERLLLEYPKSVSKWTASEGTVDPRLSGGFVTIRGDDTPKSRRDSLQEKYILKWWPVWEARRQIHKALDTVELTWLEAQVCNLLYWRLMPISEIAKRLNTTLSGIFRARHRLLQKLTDVLDAQGFSEALESVDEWGA